jgi:hypothetical protein
LKSNGTKILTLKIIQIIENNMASNIKVIGIGGDISFVGLCKNGHSIGELFYEDFNDTIKNHNILPDGKCSECGVLVFYTNEGNIGEFNGLDCKDEDIERLKLHGLFWFLKKGNIIWEKLFLEGQTDIGNNEFMILCNPIKARIIHKNNLEKMREEHLIELDELVNIGKIIKRI